MLPCAVGSGGATKGALTMAVRPETAVAQPKAANPSKGWSSGGTKSWASCADAFVATRQNRANRAKDQDRIEVCVMSAIPLRLLSPMSLSVLRLVVRAGTKDNDPARCLVPADLQRPAGGYGKSCVGPF